MIHERKVRKFSYAVLFASFFASLFLFSSMKKSTKERHPKGSSQIGYLLLLSIKMSLLLFSRGKRKGGHVSKLMYEWQLFFSFITGLEESPSES